MSIQSTKPRRGRPPKTVRENEDTRAELIQSGLINLTVNGFASTGIDAIIKQVNVPKGSFYYYFDSKETFGIAVIKSYSGYFAKKLDKYLFDDSIAPLRRLALFVEDAKSGMRKHSFKRGCLVGNLGQEVDVLPLSYRKLLIEIFVVWQGKLEQCLLKAQSAKAIKPELDCHELAEFFWIGWEGAVSRAKLMQSTQALDSYLKHFISGIKTK